MKNKKTSKTEPKENTKKKNIQRMKIKEINTLKRMKTSAT